MRNIYTKLLLLIAGATQKELARQVQYLKVENQILRSKLPARVVVTPQERGRLVRFGARLGKALGELVSIVHPDTLRRWFRESRKGRRGKAPKVGAGPTNRLRRRNTRYTGSGGMFWTEVGIDEPVA
jgi:putative transposase